MGGRLISRCKCKWVFFPHFRVIYFSLCEGYYGSMILGRNTPEHSPKRAWLACASSVGLCLLMWVPTMDGPLWHLDSSTKGGYSSMIILPSHLEGWFCSKKREGGGKKERKKERKRGGTPSTPLSVVVVPARWTHLSREEVVLSLSSCCCRWKRQPSSASRLIGRDQNYTLCYSGRSCHHLLLVSHGLFGGVDDELLTARLERFV